jgi:hypothetical protein
MDHARPRFRVETPPAALWAIAGIALSPFPVTAIMYCYGPAAREESWLASLMSWSAIVLAFLGGVRWGLETREPAPRAYRLAFNAVIAASAWAVLLSRGRMPDAWTLALLIGLFLIQWLFDHQPDAPSRYPTLSTALTASAGVSLALALEKAIHG